MPAFGTYAAGEVPTAAELNHPFPACQLLTTTAQTIATATVSGLTFGAGTETFDPYGWHSMVSNTDRITPDVNGYYLISATCTLAANSGTGAYLELLLNGTTRIAVSACDLSATGASSGRTVTALYPLNGTTDYVTARIYQNSGGNVNTSRKAWTAYLFGKV